MMSWETYRIFAVTTLIWCLSPGPAALLVVAQGISNGFRPSSWAIAGIAIGNTVYFALSATGIAALIQTSSTLFSILKWVGVAYLFYLGLSAMFSRASALTVTGDAGTGMRGPPAFWQALVVELSNPKALLYFVALLPQFINPNQPLGMQKMIYGVSCFF